MIYAVLSRILGARDDESGGAAILFALATPVVFSVAALAIDVGRTTAAGTRIAGAVDAATLAVAKDLRLQNLTDNQARNLALSVFNANMRDNTGATQAKRTRVQVNVNRSIGRVSVRAEYEVPSSLSKLFGVDEYSVVREAEAAFALSRNFEIALQLDVTNSMNDYATPLDMAYRLTKLKALKNATNSFVKAMLPPGANNVRIAIVPFASAVNAGRYTNDVAGPVVPGGPNCVIERLDYRTHQSTDVHPGGRILDSTRLMRAPSNGSRVCSDQPVVALTRNRPLLERSVEELTGQGGTSGHLGTAWAWYMLSPNWSSVWPIVSKPAPYSDENTLKIAILMTDGSYNTFKSDRDPDTNSFNSAAETCANMKANGVVVYTVAFDVTDITVPGDKRAQEIMKACASSADKAYLAADAGELVARFKDVASSILAEELRLIK
ncbi:MAG: TadE/TadG family type IV pilus assembly protein [Pseudomonadota bacterium]